MYKTIVPPYLKTGDRIGIVSTARKISEKELKPALGLLRTWGLEPVLAPCLFHEENQFSGSDAERAADFQHMLNEPDIKAILCARGGYGTVRMVDHIDFSSFRSQPKWIIGYSDVTVLHSHIHSNYTVESIHAAMLINFSDSTPNALESLRKALFGEQISYTVPAHEKNKKGVARAALVGGNLSVLYSLRATASDLDTKGKILFLEDLDEYLYHIDRMMMNLKRSGMLDNLCALIVGGMTAMNDNSIPFGKTAEQIIADTVAEYDYPVCFGFPAGHINDHHSLTMGREVLLEIGDTVTLSFTHG